MFVKNKAMRDQRNHNMKFKGREGVPITNAKIAVERQKKVEETTRQGLNGSNTTFSRTTDDEGRRWAGFCLRDNMKSKVAAVQRTEGKRAIVSA